MFDCLALCGGGGKGAYQIGVMRAMAEKGALDHIGYISGTSVGALNAVLFAIGDVELAENVWLKYVDPSVMLKNYDAKRYELSRDGLKRMIRYIGPARLGSRPMVYVYVHNKRLDRPEAFLLNDKNEEDITALLLASSALPVFYSPVEYKGEKYIDGGFTAIGNHPVKVLADHGGKKIVLVPLSNRFDPYNVRNFSFGDSFDLYDCFPGIEFNIIKPSEDIGQLVDGTIDFKSDSIRRRIALGYHDAIRVYNEQKGAAIAMEINDKIRELAGEVLKTSQDFEDFVSLSRFKRSNFKIKVIRAEICYDVVFKLNGWSIECHKVFPLNNRHYRIIDLEGRRRVWTLDPNEIYDRLLEFEKRRGHASSSVTKVYYPNNKR